MYHHTDVDEVALLRTELEKMHLHNMELSRQHVQYQQYFAATAQQSSPEADACSIVQFPNLPGNLNPNQPTVYLAGAMNADDWRKRISRKLYHLPVCIFNPLREGDHLQPETERTNQQLWELQYIDKCKCVVFWFPWDHPNIAASLLQLGNQLGRWIFSRKAIFVGIHPKNPDKKLIHDFVRMTNPYAYIGTNVDRLVEKLVSWIQTGIMPTNGSSSSSDDSCSHTAATAEYERMQRPLDNIASTGGKKTKTAKKHGKRVTN